MTAWTRQAPPGVGACAHARQCPGLHDSACVVVRPQPPAHGTTTAAGQSTWRASWHRQRERQTSHA
jgi:hypothetical protein